VRSVLITIIVLCAAIAAAFVIARPERVPVGGKAPERSAAARQKLGAETNEPSAEADPADEPPHPGYSLTRQDLEQGLLKVRTRAMSCHDETTPPEVIVTLTISTSGTVTSVALPAELRGTQAGECIVRALKTASFPSWAPTEKVTQVEWRYPLRFDGVE
jgi:hypothetical protein